MRLIGEDGEQLGIVNTADALGIARQRGLDLVEVAPTAVPPVCRLLDYGRFKFEQEKKEREARKNQKVILLKEVRLRPKTDDHDLDFKTKNIARFIEDGEKVKVTIRFRGRELAHPNIGRQQLEHIANRLLGVAVVERMPQLEGNAMTMILSKGKSPAAQEPVHPADSPPPREQPATANPPARPPATSNATPEQPAKAPAPPPAASNAAPEAPAAPKPPTKPPAAAKPVSQKAAASTPSAEQPATPAPAPAAAPRRS